MIKLSERNGLGAKAFDDGAAGELQHPGNVWSLHGYHECLRLLGKAAEAKKVPKNIGTTNCVGRSVQVVTDVTITKDQQLQLEKQPVCLSE